MKIFMLIFFIVFTVKVYSQTIRCDQYGYTYCYLKYLTDQEGNIIYNDQKQPRLTEFSTNDPTSEPNLRYAPTIPLKICFTNAMTIDNLWTKRWAWCEGTSYTDSLEFGAHFRAVLNTVLHEVQVQLDVCGFDGSQTKLLELVNCDDIPNDDLINSAIIVHFRVRGMQPNAPAAALGGWVDQYGYPTIRNLWINIDDDFIIANKVLPKTEWCFSGQCENCKYSSYNDAYCLDFRRIFLHEIGHFLGLAHLNACMTVAQYPAESPTEYKKEVMFDKYTCSNFNDFNMSCYMQCALQKIYCPDQAKFALSAYSLAMSGNSCPVVGRVETYYSGDISFSLFPSVTNNRFSFFLNNFTGPIEIKIVSASGTVVIRESKYINRSYMCDYFLGNVSSGNYFFIVSDGVRVGVLPFIVRK